MSETRELELYFFRYNSETTGKRIRSRYRATREEILRRFPDAEVLEETREVRHVRGDWCFPRTLSGTADQSREQPKEVGNKAGLEDVEAAAPAGQCQVENLEITLSGGEIARSCQH